MNINAQPIIALYEDEHYLAVNKPTGLACQTADSSQSSLIQLIHEQLNKKAYLTHRLDQPVSGLVLLAKTPRVQSQLQTDWQAMVMIKKYLAIVEGHLQDEAGLLTHRLKKKGYKSILHPGGKSSRLQYEVLNKLDRYTILSIKLKTGRFHQIRAQFSAIGHPIKGDVKYGARRKNPNRGIHLHAYQLQLKNGPLVTAPVPMYDNLWEIVAKLLPKQLG